MAGCSALLLLLYSYSFDGSPADDFKFSFGYATLSRTHTFFYLIEFPGFDFFLHTFPITELFLLLFVVVVVPNDLWVDFGEEKSAHTKQKSKNQSIKITSITRSFRSPSHWGNTNLNLFRWGP
jgi:hypothetical protein